MPSGFEGRTDTVTSAELEQSVKNMDDLYGEIASLDNQVRAIANEYGIYAYFEEPGNEDLIGLMKNKFRKKKIKRKNPWNLQKQN